MRRLVFVLGLLAAGCANQPSDTVAVSAAKTALTGAEKLALQYAVLPSCTGKNGPDGVSCSQPGSVAKIKVADNAAYAAIRQWAAAPASTDAANTAQQALDALATLLAALTAPPAP